LEARAAELEAFRDFAARFGAADTWVEAAVAARQAPDDRFAAELAKALRPKAATLRALWDALDVEPLHAVVDDPALHGPVVRAYRLLLTAERAMPGRHGFLLKRPALQAVRS